MIVIPPKNGIFIERFLRRKFATANIEFFSPNIFYLFVLLKCIIFDLLLSFLFLIPTFEVQYHRGNIIGSLGGLKNAFMSLHIFHFCLLRRKSGTANTDFLCSLIFYLKSFPFNNGVITMKFNVVQTPVESMSRFIKDMNEKGMAGLSSEYRKIDIEDVPVGSHKAFVMNMAKNRYSGKIFP